MKKSLIIAIAVICSAVILSSLIFSGGAVKTSAETAKVTLSPDEAVLLEILNENFVYGSDFDDVDNIVNCSANNFKSDVSEEGYVAEAPLKEFVYDMYGIEVVDLSKLNPGHTFKSGYLYAIPGFTRYEHSNIKLTENEDGTVTAETDIKVGSLSGDAEKLKAKTLFVKNADSKFGYNIIYSEIFSDAALA